MPRALRATRSAMCNKRRQPIEEEQQRLGLGAPTRSTGLPSHSQPRQPPCGLLAAALYNCAAPMMSQLGEPPHHHEAAWRLDPGRGGEVTRTSKELASQTPEAAPKCASSPTTGFVPGISTTDLPWHLTVELRCAERGLGSEGTPACEANAGATPAAMVRSPPHRSPLCACRPTASSDTDCVIRLSAPDASQTPRVLPKIRDREPASTVRVDSLEPKRSGEGTSAL